QPHLFTRTRDFADDFAKVLGLSDTLILMPIYPARELPLPGITSEWLAGNVVADEKHVLDADGVKEFVAVRKPELLVTVGAGNIGLLVEPLQEVRSKGEMDTQPQMEGGTGVRRGVAGCQRYCRPEELQLGEKRRAGMHGPA